MNRPVFIYVGIAIALPVIVGLIAWNVRAARRANPEGQRRKPDYRTPGTEIKETADGLPPKLEVVGPSVVWEDADRNPVWRAAFKGVYKYEEQARRIVGNDVHWELARKENSVAIDAGRLEYDPKGEGNALFKGGVSIKALEDREFRAEEARYDAATDRVICTGDAEFRWLNYEGSVGELVIDLKAHEMRGTGGGRLARR